MVFKSNNEYTTFASMNYIINKSFRIAPILMITLASISLVLISCEKEPTNNNNNTTTTRAYEGTWEWDGRDQLVFDDTSEGNCDSLSYMVYTNYQNTQLDLVIDTSLVKWIEFTKSITTAPDRPAACGGPQNDESTDDDSWNATIESRKENELLIAYSPEEKYSLIFTNITSNSMTVALRYEKDQSIIFTHKFNKKS